MKRVASVIIAILFAALPARADSLGSVTGGQAGNQSSMSGGVCTPSPSTLVAGQQAGIPIDCNSHAMITGVQNTSGSTINPATLDAQLGVQTTYQGTVVNKTVLINPLTGAYIDPTTPATIGPTSSTAVAPSSAQCTTACASLITSGAHNLYGLNFSATATGWLLLEDATSCAANGTVTPLRAYAYPTANTTVTISWGDIPKSFATGIAACFSTSGPYTATASTTAFIAQDYK